MTGRHGRVSPSEVTTQIAAFEPGLRPGWQWPASDPPDAESTDDPDPKPAAEDAPEATIEFARPNVTVGMMQRILDKLREI